MMTLQRWEPIAHLHRMEEDMDRMFRPTRLWSRYREKIEAAPIDMYYTDDALVVKAVVPGLSPEDVELTITGGHLTLKGESKHEKHEGENGKGHYLLRESRFASFSRSVALPKGLETEKADASYENGVLTITIPRSEEVKLKALKINVKAVEGKKA